MKDKNLYRIHYFDKHSRFVKTRIARNTNQTYEYNKRHFSLHQGFVNFNGTNFYQYLLFEIRLNQYFVGLQREENSK